MIRRVVCSLVVATVTAATAAAIEAPLPRHPAPSPDGSQIAFSWQGDLWLVSAQGGQAARLTAHPAVERFPVWSRDGSLIAFASDRHGNFEVFVMPVDRSSAVRSRCSWPISRTIREPAPGDRVDPSWFPDSLSAAPS